MIEATWGAATDVGQVRTRNEDAYLAGASLWAVADGMGGYRRGDLAATMAVGAMSADRPLARGDLLDQIRRANSQIAAAAESVNSPMGTTLCGLALTGDVGAGSLIVFNVGDSRAYRLRPEAGLDQLTRDHSVVQELIDAGELDVVDATTHPERNVVTRFLGFNGHLDIDWDTLDARTGDRYLICSDGLVRELDEAAIAATLAHGFGDPTETARELVDRAVEAGGRDNVTVVVVDIVSAPTSSEAPATSDLSLDVPTSEMRP